MDVEGGMHQHIGFGSVSWEMLSQQTIGVYKSNMVETNRACNNGMRNTAGIT